MRGGLQVEQLRHVHFGIPDQLPAIVADSALHVAVGEEQLGSRGGRLAGDHRPEAGAVHPLRNDGADQVGHGGVDVEQVDKRGAAAMRHARTGEDQRRLRAVVVEVLLAEQAVAADGDPLIRRENDDRVVGHAELAERLQQAPDVMVQPGDGCVVLVQRPADLRLAPRPRGQQLVADGHLAVVERVHRQVAGRQGDVVPVVEVEIALRRHARVVRVPERQVHEERPSVLLPGRLLQEGNRLVRDLRPGSPSVRSPRSSFRYLLISNCAWMSGAVLPRLPWW